MSFHRPLALLLFATLLIGLNMRAFAQDTQPTSPPEETRPSVQNPSSQGTPNEKEGKEGEKEKGKKKHPPRGAIVAAPLPVSSPAIGSGIIPVLGYIFPFSTKDKVSPLLQ